MTEWHLFRKEPYQHAVARGARQPRSIVLLAILALCGGSLLAAEVPAPSGKSRAEIVALTNISPERGREFLSRLKLATASKLPGTNRLLVTAPPDELRKALIVLDLVDTRTEFDVKELTPPSGKAVPSNAQIAAVVDGISIGTFANPPQDRSKMRAIVDVHNGKLVAIAPVFQLQDIRLAVELGPGVLKQRKALANPLNVAAGELTLQTTTPSTSPKDIPGLESSVSTGTQTSPRAPGYKLPVTGFVEADTAPGQTAWTKQTQERSQELRGHADRLQAQYSPLSESMAKPEPAASVDLLAADAKSVARQDNVRTAASTAPKPAENAQGRQEVAAQPNEPTVTTAPAPQPVEAAPSSPTTPVVSQPEPSAEAAPMAASTAAPQEPTPATPQEQTHASSFDSPELPNGDQVLDLTLQDKMPIIQLLDLVGKYLNLSYVYNPADVQGEVSLKLNGKLNGQIRVKDLYPLLEQSLRQNNLVTTRHKGNVVAVVPTARALEIDPVLIDPSEARVQVGDTVVTTNFELKHIDTTAAKNLLDNLKLGLDVTPIPEKHMLIVTTYAYRMERIERLLKIVDQPGEPRKFRYRQLRYTMAKTLAEKVKAMAEQMLESVDVTVAEPELTAQTARLPGESDVAYRTRLNQIRAQQTVLRAQRAAARAQQPQESKPSVYLDADERTNRVLMIGAEDQLDVVEKLVDALDVEQQDLRALQLYQMKYVDAEEVARKLFELGIISKSPDSSTASRYGTGTQRITQPQPGQPRPATPTATPEAQVAPTTEVTEKGLVEEPQVVVVEATNSLLVNATAEQHAKIAHIIEYVDSETLINEIPYKIYPLENSSPSHLAETLQSLIQDTVDQQKEGGKIEKVVVNRDEKIKIVPDPNTYSLIVYANKKNQEWISNLVMQLDKRRPQVLIDVTLVAITNHDKFDYDLNLIRSSPNLAATSGITGVNSSDSTIGRAISIAGGGLTAFYGDSQIQALLDTIQEKTYGRVLAKPKLLVNDNEEGKIDTKDITYVETTSALPVSSGVSGTTGGLVQTSTSFQEYDAGVMLDITPHISEGDLLRLDINLVRSDFGLILGDRPPDKKSSEVNTTVTLPNGTTVILGGMVKLNQSKGGAKVPLLGDIPILGGLFRTIHNKSEGEQLYMFVKAEIIRPDEASSHGMGDLEVLSQRNRQAFEEHELKFQRYQDWPGIKPRQIYPPKVLDAQ